MKGMIGNPDLKIFMTFQVNPTQVQVEKSVSYDIEEVSGWPAPLVTWISGGAKRIRFELFSDKSNSGKANGLFAVSIPGIGVRDIQAFIETFLYPSESVWTLKNLITGQPKFTAPPDCYLIFGARWARTKLLSAPMREVMFDGLMTPTRMFTNLEFVVIEEGDLATYDNAARKTLSAMASVSSVGNLL